MPVGDRQLNVLGEFKPFGSVAEAFDGKSSSDNPQDDYSYFLFDPEVARQRDDAENTVCTSSTTDGSEHELFIRGNRIIWSIGARVYKRFSFPSKVLKACWCRMGDLSEALLCVLQINSLTIYNTSGEVASVPLPHSIISVWPLPFGLLLQDAPEGNFSVHIPFSFPSASLSTRDIARSRREVGYSSQNNSTVTHAFDFIYKADGTSGSSHLILKDPLEEPQPTYIEERGKLNIIKEFDERTIWTSNCVPLMASYNKGKMQHSVWVAEIINSNLEVVKSGLSDVVPAGVLTKQISFRRIWQGKGSHAAASKVFLATDDDAVQIICFLLHDQKKLLSVRLHSVEIDDEIVYDIKPDMSWSIPAIAAEPVIVTRPRVNIGLLPFADIIALTLENSLLLYSGKQCLCRYTLPSFLGNHQLSWVTKSSETSIIHEIKATGLTDAVQGRVNVVVNSGKIYRCILRCNPSSSLVNDCITAMAEALNPSFYNRFLVLLWGDSGSAFMAKVDSAVNSEWESFCHVVMTLSRRSSDVSLKLSSSDSHSSWEFLINSMYHKNYGKHKSIAGIPPVASCNLQGSDSSRSLLMRTDNHEESFYIELLKEILDSLHAVYENLKLDILRKRDVSLLVVLLCNIADSLREEGYLDYYMRDFPSLSNDFGMSQSSLMNKTPPSLFRWLESCLLHGYSSAKISDLPFLIRKDGTSAVCWARKIVSFYSLLCGAEQLGKGLSSGVCYTVASGSHSTKEELVVLAMVGEAFGLQELDLLPVGVSLPLRHALAKCRDSPPTDWPAAAYILLGREDLAWSCPVHPRKPKENELHTNGSLTFQSAPYMAHLQPVTIPSLVSDTIELENTKLEDVDSVDGSLMDGMEHIFNSSTQLRYGRDLRLNEVRHILCSARAIAIQTPVSPTASDQDLQQAQLWQLAQRTTSLPFGRGAFTLATTCTLLTEALTVPKLVLAGRLPAQQNATVNLDPNVRNVQELKCWPEFHNAVAAGLKLAPLQGKMSRTWIVYNKPEEPNVVHAGLLLALGLHGHLRVLTITDIYQYYSQEHESTTVGLMLGLAASYRGTMQPAISKSLYVHIPARHPSSFPELELPTLLQSAALLSVGLLYEGSAHPQTMQILLGEIGRRSGGDNVLEREGYAVSAGFALGLVALGRGEDAPGFMESLVDRLFQFIGGKEQKTERFYFLTQPVDEHQRTVGQVMDGTLVNIDVTAPGAIVALALMYMKTESKLILSRLSIPQTHFDLQYVRPDFIMLRVIARNLILWSRIYPSEEWIQSQVPKVVQHCIDGLADEMDDANDMDAEAFVQAFVNIVVGACISLGLRFAGTRDGRSQELLYDYAVYFLNEIKSVSVSSKHSLPKGLSNYVDRGTLETCLHLIVLSLCVVMAGSGHLQTLRLLKFLRNRNSTEGHSNYGAQMAVSLGIGFLFLGGGMRTFSTSNTSIAALLITLYPRLPAGPNDNRCHLQAFRHLYVLATEARLVQTVDVDTGMPVYAPLEITVRETEHYAETSFCEVTPCILPECAVLKTVRVCGPRYWPHVIELIPEEKPWWASGDKDDPFNSGFLYIKRKVGACSYVDDPVGCQSLLSRTMHKVGLACLRTSSTRTERMGAVTLDQLISTFSSDPSLIAFAQRFCEPSWNNSSDVDFQEFCLQVLFECVSKDRPAFLQVYLSLYTTIGSMVDEITSATCSLGDSLSLWSIKLALAYNEALLNGRLTIPNGGIVQSTFLGSLKKRLEEILNLSLCVTNDFHEYLLSGRWPKKDTTGWKRSILLSWYLQWHGVPPSIGVRSAREKIKLVNISSSVPLLHLLFPGTHVTAIGEIYRCWLSSRVDN
ncbi:anaphase-promoting complex subunit 1 [Coffea eugenioides]|uniref:anaphase-promoting complex subunit 1 n=1 Tax=Coffea eugenioides TaxID=49369 RepID=UPI000F6146C2|nr:anaphase-promoting complex subunit 1 [Coffea eugenioides]